MIKEHLYLKGKECPLCDLKDIYRFTARAFDSDNYDVNINECLNCHLAWQYPKKTSIEDGKAFFEESYHDMGSRGSGYFDPQYKEDIAILQMEYLKTLIPKSADLLEIGAGAGIFAQIASNHGWRVTAIDPALPASSGNHNDARVNYIKGTLDNLDKNRKYKIITMWDVIEHVEDPLDLVLQAKNYLTDNGLIVIETGNYLSYDRIEGASSWWAYQLDHSWYFSPSTLKYLLGHAGFTKFELANRVFRPQWSNNMVRPYPSIPNLIRRILRHPFLSGEHIRRYNLLHESTEWESPELSIFTLVAKC